MLLIFDSLALAVDDLLRALKHEPNFYFQGIHFSSNMSTLWLTTPLNTVTVSGVTCFMIYRLIYHINLWKKIDRQGVYTSIIDSLPWLQMEKYR